MKAQILSHTTKMRFPKGTYFVGDPCYCFNSKTWDEIGRQTDGFGDDTIMAELRDFTMWSEGTAYGDGEYTDQFGNHYSVDAGLIGIVPIEIVENKGYDLHTLGLIHTFTRDFVVESDGEGLFTIGHIRIDTTVDCWGDEAPYDEGEY